MSPDERYVPAKHSLLTEAEIERLVLLIEECTEVIQAATKTLRWGYDDTHPGTGEKNRDMVMRELRDLMTIRLIMERAGDLPESTEATQEKMVKLRRYTLHQSPEILASVLFYLEVTE